MPRTVTSGKGDAESVCEIWMLKLQGVTLENLRKIYAQPSKKLRFSSILNVSSRTCVTRIKLPFNAKHDDDDDDDDDDVPNIYI
jgi:hypothetical protein